jgi:hypothetical protein
VIHLPNLTRIITDDNGVVIKEQNYHFKIFDDSKGYLFRANSNYIKGYQGIRLSEIINNKADFANMHILAEHLYKDTNMISTYCNRRYKAASIEDIAKIIDLNMRHTKEFLVRMINAEILMLDKTICGEHVEIRYFANPLYFMTSKWLSPALYMMFRHTLDMYLTQTAVNWFNSSK